MKPMSAEWVAKAEGDFAMMERECQVTENPNYDGICFHAQQCAEKYLKARLCEADITFSKIHDLVALLDRFLKSSQLGRASEKTLHTFRTLPCLFAIPANPPTPNQQSTPSVAAANFALQPVMHWD